MKIGRIVHQQVMQLKWHFLACFGLMMALPLEEAIMTAWEGKGFYATHISLGISVAISPLLAALIACANVQADLDDKRYLFWRSKPVSISLFMIIKYIVGLLISFVMIACPILFTYISCNVVQHEKINHSFYETIIIFQVITLLAYSLCFFCNVLIRKTARAWLVGMALTGFLILVPFILPLNVKGMGDVLDYLFVHKASLSMRIVILFLVAAAPSLLALTLSLIAAARNWHLKTNLKGLLWAGAAVIFLLALFVSRQVANIKVLDEKEVNYPGCFKNIDGKIFLEDQLPEGHFLCQPNQEQKIGLGAETVEKGTDGYLIQYPAPETMERESFYVNVVNNKIQFETVDDSVLRTEGSIEIPKHLYQKEGYRVQSHPWNDFVFYKNDKDIYVVVMHLYWRRENPDSSRQICESILLRSYKYKGIDSELVSEIDLSDFISNSRDYPNPGIRQIGNKIIAVVNQSCLVAEFVDGGHLEVLEKNKDQLKRYSTYSFNRDKKFSIPMVPLQALEIQDRMKLSIDLNCEISQYNRLFRYSMVDEYKGGHGFIVISEKGIERFNVINWDDKNIFCEYRDARLFTILERLFGNVWEYKAQSFIWDGKLYAHNGSSLMVFDVRSQRIRKLGHYVHPRNSIKDIRVLQDGNILIYAKDKEAYKVYNRNIYASVKDNLYLLKNPK